jgi:ethanolamine utilization protein EutA
MNEAGGRLFFTNARRSIVDEDEIIITSIGIDIGSSTTHLALSRLTLERADSRYIVANREVIFESDILLTPYAAENTIDTDALQTFFTAQYKAADISFDRIDTGALILTGTAVRRRNARAIADMFANAAGKFVSVSAGDGMEAILAAHGAGAVALSATRRGEVLNIDIGGGTTKLARCAGGEIVEVTAIDIGARLIALDTAYRITRLEPAGREIGQALGLSLSVGDHLPKAVIARLAEAMADHIILAATAAPPPATARLLRLPALTPTRPAAAVTVSGGVSEYIYDRAVNGHGDLGLPLARALLARLPTAGLTLMPATQGIRATVLGASQYTVQLSGSTIYVSDLGALPTRNLATIAPRLADGDGQDAATIAQRIRHAIAQAGIADIPRFALSYDWHGSATFHRLHEFAKGVVEGFAPQLAAGHPLVLIGDTDIGGLIGLHLREEFDLPNTIISIDGVTAAPFDFIDIGAMLEGSGAVPVVIKSLVFPGNETIGRSKV